jgi:hypothetical protein
MKRQLRFPWAKTEWSKSLTLIFSALTRSRHQKGAGKKHHRTRTTRYFASGRGLICQCRWRTPNLTPLHHVRTSTRDEGF